MFKRDKRPFGKRCFQLDGGGARTQATRRAAGWEWDRRYAGSPLSYLSNFYTLLSPIFLLFRDGGEDKKSDGVVLQRFYNKHNQGKQLA